ncbi:MAG: hypothetical protein F4Z95_05365 [Gammaproteobacteria bacterium]|nr:hypothetical protein [Gammaproteobacteria bacterium]MYC23075.1 hypothetical protein [Caldilineaceae bacterium SB0662_bin_25]
MPSWADLQDELNRVDPVNRGDFLADKSLQSVACIADRYDRNVLYYASSFLQKPQIPGLFTSINMEDINGFMAGVHGHDFSKGLLLILHTPGGLAEAAQTVVDYLRSKFSEIDVLVPTYAMSAGTMIALGCDRIVMGRQSQLGPTDPQLIAGDRPYSAHSIVEQFEEAKIQISGNPVLAHAWAPVLRSFGPALLQEARKSIAYGQTLVQDWLQKYMFSDKPNPAGLAREVAKHFGGNQHGSHGRRIGRDEARQQHLEVINLEDDQELQEEVLTLYHLSTIAFEMSPAAKSVMSSNGRLWIKNM